MRFEIDTDLKTVKIHGQCSIDELINTLMRMFPDFSWKDWKLIETYNEWAPRQPYVPPYVQPFNQPYIGPSTNPNPYIYGNGDTFTLGDLSDNGTLTAGNYVQSPNKVVKEYDLEKMMETH